jgi:acyl dehydratase
VSGAPIRYDVTARNWATASENKIHDDDVARRFGFSGGLVPGVAVFAYMIRPCLERWDSTWLERGWLDARFVAPVYDGETVTVELDDRGELSVLNQSGQSCATGNAGLHSEPAPSPNALPATPLPETRPLANNDLLAPGTVLGTVDVEFHLDGVEEYLASIGDDSPLHRGQPVAHPGWLLLGANLALVSNVRLGPWIHVESDAKTFCPVTDGQTLSTRARVTETFERKGHQFVALDVLVLADGAPAMRVNHVAIWQLRGS